MVPSVEGVVEGGPQERFEDVLWVCDATRSEHVACIVHEAHQMIGAMDQPEMIKGSLFLPE
ncbi:hypothetical protein GCM10010429_38580 [Micromonospora olivasterospora]